MARKLWAAIGDVSRQRHRAYLVVVSALGLGIAWWRYPAENHFSILSCTISFLGSPDLDRNPQGWRFYQAGMTALVVLLLSLGLERHVKLRARAGNVAVCSSALLAVSLALVLVVTWITRFPAVALVRRAGRAVAHAAGDSGHPDHGLWHPVGWRSAVVVRCATEGTLAISPLWPDRPGGHLQTAGVGEDVPAGSDASALAG